MIFYDRMDTSCSLRKNNCLKQINGPCLHVVFFQNICCDALTISQGAFTGVCSEEHVPTYMENIDKFKAKGIDSVICVAINDPYTMNAWAEKLQAKDAVSYPVFLALLLKKSFMC